MPNMHYQERQLQLLRRRFVQWTPWLVQATKASVRISPLGDGKGNAFKVIATWDGGEHEKVFDIGRLLQQGHVSCTRDYARAFVKEVLGKRGIL